jgi:uncharacterized protein (UPF0297 family)
VADLKQALDEGRVSFGAEEINKTLESVLASLQERGWPPQSRSITYSLSASAIPNLFGEMVCEKCKP